MITADEIWEALLHDPSLKGKEYAYQVMRSRVDALPKLLKGELSQKANVRSLMQSRLVFTWDCLHSTYIHDVVEVTPTEHMRGYSKEEMTELLDATFRSSIFFYTSVLVNVENFLASVEYTEAQAMRSDLFSLDVYLYIQYQKGKLTVEDVLRHQPGAIILDRGPRQ